VSPFLWGGARFRVTIRGCKEVPKPFPVEVPKPVPSHPKEVLPWRHYPFMQGGAVSPFLWGGARFRVTIRGCKEVPKPFLVEVPKPVPSHPKEVLPWRHHPVM
jgi:hypothetical protein